MQSIVSPFKNCSEKVRTDTTDRITLPANAVRSQQLTTGVTHLHTNVYVPAEDSKLLGNYLWHTHFQSRLSWTRGLARRTCTLPARHENCIRQAGRLRQALLPVCRRFYVLR